MLYLSTKDVLEIGFNWNETVRIIKDAVHLLNRNNYDQPIKPYLNFNNPRNRIIAMPARAGGDFSVAGIKWIASFPENIDQGIPRAHSVTILNDEQTGVPLSVINTPLVSGIRTASVSGLMINEFLKHRAMNEIAIGIIGFGPIGQLHLKMVEELAGDKIVKVYLYDLRNINEELIPVSMRKKIEIVKYWEDAYVNADIFITCTVSSKGYINKQPKSGALLLNVSLRDFNPRILDYTKSIVVDNWEEVCRADTDIEVFHNTRGLKKEDTINIVDVVCNNGLLKFPKDDAVMFNPMGMALFDIAISNSYYRQALQTGIGVELEG
ncbi:2,3-diaminopropionate biosynthesis protein SbnB [Fictibacillus nanhaiensis]|uniref:2,3-diaminopropionate biosynthesis protein SbnB n=1 Tax=Fictibacillus nanhaiensis TaxID=742169 RepID=UPI003C289C8F